MCFLAWGKVVQQSQLFNGDLLPGSKAWPKVTTCGRVAHAQPCRTLTPELPGFPFEPVREAKDSMRVFRQQGRLTHSSPLKTEVILKPRQYAWSPHAVVLFQLPFGSSRHYVRSGDRTTFEFVIIWNWTSQYRAKGLPTTTTEQKSHVWPIPSTIDTVIFFYIHSLILL